MAGAERFAALDLVADPTVVVAGDGRVAYANVMLGRLLGVDAGGLVGRPARDVLPIVDEAGADWWECGGGLRGDVRLLRRIPETDVLVQAADGRVRPAVLVGARHPDDDGDLGLLVLSLRRGERRRRLDAARSDLVSTVSHELRSPLTSVKGFTKTLLVKWDRFTDAQRRQMLATVHEDADRVTRLLGDLLDVSRIDAGRLPLRRQMVDLAEVVGRVLGRAAVVAEPERLVADLPTLPKVYADPDKIEQVLTNLVENGLKYGGGTVRVTAQTLEGALRVTVSDEGPGIEPAYLGHIFTKFFRRPGERRSGTGLGLYISRGIVHAHGGELWAESGEGSGARFHFTLPLGGLELAGVPPRAAEVDGSAAGARGRRP